jgi:hypothetical protein
MPEYKCVRCGYATQRLSLYRDHLKRQRVCIDVQNSGQTLEQLQSIVAQAAQDKVSCPKCAVRFTSRGMRHYHMRHCRADQVAHDPMPSPAQPVSSVKLAPIGDEDFSYFTGNAAQATSFLFDQVFSHDNSVCGLTELIKRKHFHPEHPENHNVRLNGNMSTWEVWDGKNWETGTMTNLLREILMYIRDEVEVLVNKSILEASPVVAKSRRQVLDSWTTRPGSAMLFCFPDVKPHGCLTIHPERGIKTVAQVAKIKLEYEADEARWNEEMGHALLVTEKQLHEHMSRIRTCGAPLGTIAWQQ